MCNRHSSRRPPFFLRRQPPELVLQKTVLFARNAPGAFGERAAQPTVSLGGLAALVLTRTAVVPRADPRPGTEVLLARKLAHVGTDFRHSPANGPTMMQTANRSLPTSMPAQRSISAAIICGSFLRWRAVDVLRLSF